MRGDSKVAQCSKDLWWAMYDVIETYQRRKRRDDFPLIRFKHYSSGNKTPVSVFKLRMEQIHNVQFAEVKMAEWIKIARGFEIEDLVVGYLEAIVARGEESFHFCF